MERFPEIPHDRMTSLQQKVAAEIAGGPRGGLRGPFNAWLRAPALADRYQKVGEYIRFDTSLPKALNELAILMVARQWKAQFEWYAHYKLALQAGLSAEVADAIGEGRRPKLSDDEARIHTFVTQLLNDHEVSDEAFAAVRDRFGEQGVIELIGACGYYTAVSMTLNVSRVPVPDDSVKPLT